MYKRIILIIICSVFILAPCYGFQELPVNEDQIDKSKLVYSKKEGEFFVAATMTGAGVGFKYRRHIYDDVTLLTFNFQICSARGEREAIVYDPYYYYPYKVGREYFTFFMPFYIGIQRRMFKDKIESNFRPFILGEVGPTFGVSFPTKYSFSKNLKKGTGEPTVGSYLGIGVEFGSEEEGKSAYTFGVGYRILSFFNTLGEKKNYSSITLRIGWVFRW